MKSEVKTKELIEQIHNEFLTAGDILLEKARDVLESKTPSEAWKKKAKRLESLGFSSSRDVTDLEARKQDIIISEVFSRKIVEYKRWYPFNKFISRDSVKRINQEYNLILGKSSQYTGFVPEKNLKEIEAFKGIRLEHAPYDVKRNPFDHGLTHDSFEEQTSVSSFITGLDGRPAQVVSKKDMGILKLDLMICAPEKDFKLEDWQRVENREIVGEKPEVPDPIVLHEIEFGYLILTAWGDEASDPDVVNEVNN